MKRVITCASRSTLITRIINGFMSSPDVTSVNTLKTTDNYVRLELFGPKFTNGSTTITVWYDYNNVKNGQRREIKRLEWKPDYTVDPSGDVYDGSGNLIGEACVMQDTGVMKTATKKNFLIKSVRTDSGDVIIDHPETNPGKIYQDVVDQLIVRKITKRS